MTDLSFNRAFLKHNLTDFAKQNPSIEMVVSPRPNKHPIIRGAYSISSLRPPSQS